jgi:hypothetical protein
LLHIASIVVLVVTVAFASGALRLPDRHTLWPFVAQERARSDNYWLAAQIRHLPEGGMVPLAAGEVHARWPTFGSERISTIAGAGAELTTLHLEEFPTSTSVAVGGKRQPPMQAMRCGPGDDACLIGDRVRLTNLTITFR